MKRTLKQLPVTFSLASKFPTTSSFIRPITTKDNDPKLSSDLKNDRESLIMGLFKRRQQKGTVKVETNQFQSKPSKTTSCSDFAPVNDEEFGPSVMSSFLGLGLTDELIAAVEEIGIETPTEIQCVGIPAVLDGKCVVLSSSSGDARTLAYLLPLVQLLRQNKALNSMKPKHPRAIVLCTTEELSDECFRVAKFISDHARSKTSSGNVSNGPGKSLDAPMGMLVGTPGEIFEQIEEGYVFCDDINYLVLDEADKLLNHGFGPTVQKIIIQLRDPSKIQSILVTPPVSEMVDETKLSPFMTRVQKNHGGEVAAMLLEMDRTEAFDLLKSADGLKKKLAEAMDSLHDDEVSKGRFLAGGTTLPSESYMITPEKSGSWHFPPMRMFFCQTGPLNAVLGSPYGSKTPSKFIKWSLLT